MAVDKESELKVGLEKLTSQLGFGSYIFLYLEGNRVKIIGDLSLSALAPLLWKWLAKEKG